MIFCLCGFLIELITILSVFGLSKPITQMVNWYRKKHHHKVHDVDQS